MDATAELVADHPCILGEGPIWHPVEHRLYWTDIHGARIFCFDPERSEFREVLRAPLIGGLTIQSDGSLLLFMSDGRVASFNNGALRTAIVSVPKLRGYRFNDCIADPVGRVYSGTIAYVRDRLPIGTRAARKLKRILGVRPSRMTGRLYRFDADGGVAVVVRGIGRPNGMGFSPDRTRFYLTDSLTRSIHAYDFDESRGAITNPRLFVRAPSPSTPDGLTVDRSGAVWSAHNNGGCVVCYRPDGTEERRILLPTPQVTSLSFGGADYGDLYITTAGGHRRDRYGTAAGGLFRVRPGAWGQPEFRSRIPV